MTILTWIAVGLLIVAGLWGGLSYNRLVVMRQRCRQAFADVDVLLRRRHDLIPGLVSSVEGYASHERALFDAIAKARSTAVAAEGEQAKAAAETLLSRMLGQLLAVAESYPTLKASAGFQQLQAQLTETEGRLADARHALNRMIQANNTMVQRFPMALIAKPFGFVSHAFFEAGEAARQTAPPPQVKF